MGNVVQDLRSRHYYVTEVFQINKILVSVRVVTFHLVRSSFNNIQKPDLILCQSLHLNHRSYPFINAMNIQIQYLPQDIHYPMKRQSKKSKYVEKQQPAKRFGFDFDPQLITLQTEIPQMPAKPRNQPDEGVHKRKLAELEERKNMLKDKRLEKKREIKMENCDCLEVEKDIKAKIELGKQCLVVLDYDVSSIEQEALVVEDKLRKRIRNLRNSQRGTREHDTKKNYEDMTVQELDEAAEKLSIRVTTESLNKKEETEINATIAKLRRFRAKAPQAHQVQRDGRGVQENQAAIERLKSVKKQLEQEKEQTQSKIQAIKKDLEEFEERLQEIQEKKKNPEAEVLKQEADELKTSIRETRDQIAALQQAFEQKKYQYEYDQTKINWIKFASEVKDELNKQWEEDKAERRRKRQLEKSHPEGDKQAQTQNDHKRVSNQNQKQIDACNTLIGYCRDLIPKGVSAQLSNQRKEQQIDLNEELQKGEWKYQKNVQLVTSKKSIQIEQTGPRHRKKKSRKHESQSISSNPDQLKHSVFIEQIFDSVNMLPPTRIEQLEKTIDELANKLEIYQKDPEQTDGKTQKYQRYDKQRQKYTAEKYVKAKNQSKKINAEDFPTLQ